jgi:alpha/beta superfamily hydrolase
MAAHTPLVFLLHGRASSPQSPKMQALHAVCLAKGLEDRIPDFSSTNDPHERLARLKDLIRSETRPLIFAASSMGGYVATRVSQETPIEGLFLIAPALYRPTYSINGYAPKARAISIIHGWNDDIVPIEESIRFAKSFGGKLYAISGDHYLDDQLSEIQRAFAHFLDDITSTQAIS